MGKVLANLGQKGGTGKTTTSISIADGLTIRGYSTLIIDRDSQESSIQWADKRKNNTISVMDGKSDKIDIEIDKQKNLYDFVIIDGAPRVDPATIRIVKKSDLVIIPIKYCGLDVWASSGLIELIKLIQQGNQNLPLVRFLITMSKKNSILSKSILEALEIFQFPVLKQFVSNLEIYMQSVTVGKSVFSNMPNQGAKEMNLVIDEILEILQCQNR